MPHPHNGRGNIYRDKGDLDRALAEYSEAIRLDPKMAIAYNGRGNTHRDKGEADKALADYSDAIRLDPKMAHAYNGRGNVYSDRGERDRALAEYNEAIQLNPKFSYALRNRGDVYREKGDNVRALADYSEAIRLDPKYPDAYNGRGIVYYNKGDNDAAIADYSEAIRLSPKFAMAWRNRGLAYEKKSDLPHARENFATALSIKPDYTNAKNDLARVGGRLEDAQHTPAVVAEKPSLSIPIDVAPSGHVLCNNQRRVALVVGNSDYPAPGQLANPVHDAEDVKRLLEEKLCFKVVFARDANFDVFTTKISEFADAAQGADVALFYYAGHGMQLNGVNLLLPVDAKLLNEYEAMRRNVSAQDVVALIEARARTTLVFLDACRTNPLENEFRQRLSLSGRGVTPMRGLAPMTVSNETLVVYATKPNTPAADSDAGQRNSPFTSAFLKYIATPDMDIELVMREVANSVRMATNGKQAPQRLTELNHSLILAPTH